MKTLLTLFKYDVVLILCNQLLSTSLYGGLTTLSELKIASFIKSCKQLSVSQPFLSITARLKKFRMSCFNKTFTTNQLFTQLLFFLGYKKDTYLSLKYSNQNHSRNTYILFPGSLLTNFCKRSLINLAYGIEENIYKFLWRP